MDLFRCHLDFIHALARNATGRTRIALCRLYAGRLAEDVVAMTDAMAALFQELVVEEGLS